MPRSRWWCCIACAWGAACGVPLASPTTEAHGGETTIGGDGDGAGASGTIEAGASAVGGHESGSAGQAAAVGDSGGDGGAGRGTAGVASMGGEPHYVTGLEPTAPYPDVTYPKENPNTPEKALLGKILFWEEQLSSHDTHACGTCHRPAAGGSDLRAESGALGAGPNGIFGDDDDAHGSRGVARCDDAGVAKLDPVYGANAQVTPRKAPSALDAWFFEELFWDGRAGGVFVDPVSGEIAIEAGGALESQAAGPPISDVEMACEGYGWSDIETKLSGAQPLKLAQQIPAAMAEAIAQHPSYPELFAWAFGTPQVSARRILFAIADYERQLRSDQTAWDRFNAGDATQLTPDQRAGLALFNVKARCASCHVPPMFTDNKFHNIGAHAPELDLGRSLISGEASDRGKMKTPSLRNVGLRAAGGLLHSGANSGASLRSVLGVYRQGGIYQDNIDSELRPLNLTDFEFEQLLEFLQSSLTDPRAQAELPPFDRPRLSSEQ